MCNVLPICRQTLYDRCINTVQRLRILQGKNVSGKNKGITMLERDSNKLSFTFKGHLSSLSANVQDDQRLELAVRTCAIVPARQEPRHFFFKNGWPKVDTDSFKRQGRSAVLDRGFDHVLAFLDDNYAICAIAGSVGYLPWAINISRSRIRSLVLNLRIEAVTFPMFVMGLMRGPSSRK